MSALADHRTVAPACYVLQDARSSVILAAPKHWHGKYKGATSADEAWEFDTVEAAQWARSQANLDPRHVKVRTRRPKVELTEAGRQQVRDRRATRRAERGW